MKNMLDRTMHFMEQNPHRTYTLTELRKAAGIAIRSQYRLSQQLLDSGMVVREDSKFRIADHLMKSLWFSEEEIMEKALENEEQTLAAMPMTMHQAARALTEIPADKVNDNCVLDAQWRLRDAIKLAYNLYTPDDAAPSYVIERVKNLRSWF